MRVSPGKSKPGIVPVESGQPVFRKSFYRKILYRGAFLVAMLARVLSLPPMAPAQEQRPQITPGERKVPRKKEAGPRALGVLRITASGKATLVPITILMSGKFYDASAYKAAPVPMALETGTVYEGVRTGSSLGLFTVDGALHSTVANSQTPWLGTGKWILAGSEEAKTSLKAENVPVGIDNSDAPPRLSRGGSESKATPPSAAPSSNAPSSKAPTSNAPTSSAPTSTPTTAPSTTAPSSTTPPSTTPTSATPQNAPDGSSAGSSGGTAGGTPAATPTPQTSSTSPAPNSTTPPAEPKPAKTDDHASGQSSPQPGDQTKEPDNNSGAGETNRPRLRRGKPVDPLPDEEIPGYSKLGSTPAAASTTVSSAPGVNTGKTSPAASAPGPVQLIPAISDASGPEPRSFAFDWLKSEEGERLQQMTDLAKQELRAYIAALARNRISATPAGPQSAKHRSPKPPELILENAHMVAYDLWTTNQPVLVFSAEAHLPLQAGTTADDNLQYSIMLVARTDIYNNLHRLYVAVTDKNHLDITPRLELVDAVDADGDGRGELLFRETSDAGGGWLIYRANADKLWKIFDSLNPE
jgi:hypothetical protein